MNNNQLLLLLISCLGTASLNAMRNHDLSDLGLPQNNVHVQQQNDISENYLATFYYQIADLFSMDYEELRTDIFNGINALRNRLPLATRATTNESLRVITSLFSQTFAGAYRTEAIITLANHMITIAPTLSQSFFGPRRPFRNQFNRLIAQLDSPEQQELLRGAMNARIPQAPQHPCAPLGEIAPQPLTFD